MLPRWFGLFPREQFHIAASEDFYADPERHVNEVWRFLGLAPRKLAEPDQAQPPGRLPTSGRRPASASRTHCADHNRGLEELLGRSLPWPASKQPVR